MSALARATMAAWARSSATAPEGRLAFGFRPTPAIFYSSLSHPLREMRPIEREEGSEPLFVLPHRDESRLTSRSYSMIVYRLITN